MNSWVKVTAELTNAVHLGKADPHCNDDNAQDPDGDSAEPRDQEGQAPYGGQRASIVGTGTAQSPSRAGPAVGVQNIHRQDTQLWA